MEKCYDIEMTSPSKGDLSENVPFLTLLWLQNLREFLVHLQMPTGLVPG